jgi:hypothetical protein
VRGRLAGKSEKLADVGEKAAPALRLFPGWGVGDSGCWGLYTYGCEGGVKDVEVLKGADGSGEGTFSCKDGDENDGAIVEGGGAVNMKG